MIDRKRDPRALIKRSDAFFTRRVRPQFNAHRERDAFLFTDADIALRDECEQYLASIVAIFSPPGK